MSTGTPDIKLYKGKYVTNEDVKNRTKDKGSVVFNTWDHIIYVGGKDNTPIPFGNHIKDVYINDKGVVVIEKYKDGKIEEIKIPSSSLIDEISRKKEDIGNTITANFIKNNDGSVKKDIVTLNVTSEGKSVQFKRSGEKNDKLSVELNAKNVYTDLKKPDGTNKSIYECLHWVEWQESEEK